MQSLMFLGCFVQKLSKKNLGWTPSPLGKGKVNKEDRNIDFNIITDNEALVIDNDLSNNENLILAMIKEGLIKKIVT